MRVIRHLPVLAAVVVMILPSCSRSASPSGQSEQGILDQKFREQMTGVTLVGRSSRTGSDQLSGEERYVIEKVTKLTGDTWLFQSRMQYGSKDVPIPIPVNIKWAGDTPVITLTDLAIPSVGTFTARVLLYRDQYAGTWSSTKEGGQMWGKIIRNR